MKIFRYDLRKDPVFYLLVLGYANLILSMTFKLWFGDGVNIFESYSSATDPAVMIVDANKIYWSKTCFLFLTLFLFGLNFDYRFAAGLAASFWSLSLTVIFGLTPVLIGVGLMGLTLVILQIWRKEMFSNSDT